MKNLILLTSIFSFLISDFSFPQNFWQPTNGPFGGAQVNDYLYYGDSTIFLATSEGLIKSIDNGKDWSRIPGIIKYFYSIDKDSVGNIYATATDEASNSFLYKSTNVGINWVQINNNFWADFRNVMISYKDTIIVGSWDHGLYRTFDGGLNWILINNGLDYLHIYKTVLLSNGELLVGTSGSGNYRSSNWGDNWTPSNNGIPVGGSYRYTFSILEIAPGKILCGTSIGIYYSTNFGNDWTYRSIGYGNQRATDMIMKDNNIYAATDFGGGVYSSSNQGNNWNHIGLDFSIYTLGYDLDSNICAGGLGYGLNRYNFIDSTWTEIYNKGYTATKCDIICSTDYENVYTGTWFWGLFRSTDEGNMWQGTGFKGIVEHIASIDDSTIILGQQDGVFLSTDFGNNWSQIGDYEVSALYYDSGRDILYIGTYGYVNGPEIYSSKDRGQNWEFISYLGSPCGYSWLSSIYVSRTEEYIFASSACYDIHWGSSFKFWRSTDNGQSWQIKYSDNVFDITENNNGDIYALSYNRLLISHTKGSIWITRNIEASCLALDNQDRIFYGYGGTVKMSDTEALNWATVGNHINTIINDMAISRENYIYLGTDNGVYYGDANNLVLSVDNKMDKVITFALSQNYPNPFNPTTKIKYQLPILTNVRLSVYDVLGREIKVLVNQEKPAGSYEVEFNGANFPSGVYFCRMEADKYSDTKKLLLLK